MRSLDAHRPPGQTRVAKPNTESTPLSSPLNTSRHGAKVDAWWTLPQEAERAPQVSAAARAIAEPVTWPEGIELSLCAVVDVADFGF